MPSIRQIALQAGVSPATVSSVLNGKEKERRINAASAEKIRKIAAAEGYLPNQIAISLRTGKSKMIGLIVDNITGTFFSVLANTIEKELDKFGYTVVYCSSGGRKNKMDSVTHVLLQYNLDGFLVIPSPGWEKYLDQLVRKGKPVIQVDSYFPKSNLPYVLTDNFSATAEGIKAILRKGYKKPVMVCNDLPMIQMKERIRGFKETFADAGIHIDKRDILATKTRDDKDISIAQIVQFLDRKKPDVAVFANNYLGVYGLHALKNMGWSVPKDMAVLCFDDNDLYPLFPAGITAIAQPIDDIADKAVHLLMAELKVIPPLEHKQWMLKAQLITRNSL